MTVDRYAEIHRGFRWDVPAHFNIADACCGRYAADRTASRCTGKTKAARPRAYTYWDLAAAGEPPVQRAGRAGRYARRSRRASSCRSVPRPSSPTSPATRWGRWRCRCRSCSDPTRSNTGCRTAKPSVALVDAASLPNLWPIRDRCAGIEARDRRGRRARVGHDLLGAAARAGIAHFRRVDTPAEDPALLVYTSGTTGPPKGALKPQRCLLGNLPGFSHSHDIFPQAGDMFWSPADWAWTGGLMDALLPTLYHGYRSSATAAASIRRRPSI